MFDRRPGYRAGRGRVAILNHLEFFARLIPSLVTQLRPADTVLATSPVPDRNPGTTGGPSPSPGPAWIREAYPDPLCSSPVCLTPTRTNRRGGIRVSALLHPAGGSCRMQRSVTVFSPISA